MRMLLAILFGVASTFAQSVTSRVMGPTSGGGAPTYYTVYDTVDADNEDAMSWGTTAEDLNDGGGVVWFGKEDWYDSTHVGFLFELSVPQGKTVDTCEISFYTNSNTLSATDSVKVYVYDVDNASVFDGGHTHSLLTHETIWSTSVTRGGLGDDNVFVTYTGLQSLANQVVNRGSWASGNRMGFVFACKTWVDNDYCLIEDHSSAYTNHARIKLVYH